MVITKPFGFNGMNMLVVELFLLRRKLLNLYHLKVLLEASAKDFSARHRGKGRDLLLVDVALSRFSPSKSEFKWLRCDPLEAFRPST